MGRSYEPKILLVVSFVGAIRAAPQGLVPIASKTPTVPSGSIRPVIPILVDTREGPRRLWGYRFNFGTGNGIELEEQGIPKDPDGAVVPQGAWSFTFPDGTPALFRFVADENLVPTSPPLPPQRRRSDRKGSAGGCCC
ncbi:endocuticle structural glycoprotein ABD-4-like [Macrobrachium rosenbergii]|uniref:endocuticle structural glycoprotein ABD-4-like n=1 Tax=Macrobrachium rosenbergii TaxID=79674 RepID=UPI0034D6EBE7